MNDTSGEIEEGEDVAAQQTVADRPERRADQTELLPELVAHLQKNRSELRQEWTNRITDAHLLSAMTPHEVSSEVTSVYDNYVAVLETGSVEELREYARDLSERIIPRGVESSRSASACSRITRSRSSTKLTATVLAMRFAAGS